MPVTTVKLFAFDCPGFEGRLIVGFAGQPGAVINKILFAGCCPLFFRYPLYFRKGAERVVRGRRLGLEARSSFFVF